MEDMTLSPTEMAQAIENVEGMSLSVVIPAYNEENAVRSTVEEVREALEPLNIPYEIIVVDDGSEDKTLEEARVSGATVDFNQVNSGYGATLKRGVRRAQHDYIAILDADGTYPAHYLPDMLAQCREQDMVVGDRGAAMKNVPLIRRPAKYVLNSLASFLAERKLNDLNSGLRVFRKTELIPFLPLLPQNFSFTTTITLCMTCNGKRMVYTPIEYRKRVGKSKIRAVDFVNFVILVLRIIALFNPLRIFIPLGLGFFVLGFLKFLYDLTQFNLSETAIFSFLAAIMIWSLGLIADMISRLHLRP
ncbi:glycosyltransferase family 2 protein [Pseudohalocynthiibacter sp. F2068]|jgi:glycosyltransferase involved in cell wall biosynthesis|uniref:glycosyltransferase family 2 protein n=1 Tax=Pseudohalocynthiibacter sp. F2068 TaxID=2926418 RepID=UPI001FF1650D|nr:glycosyltransferase family 2 protein [Pseudohalocynthiibacter sp. F2068]MCK0104302.1 glycosyltransferase family 2 protein [Pseudohalocynthiibacter sp. F2068]